jgi:Ca2+-binding EF-hand superfamily protein
VLGSGVDIDDSEWEKILEEVDEDGNGEISFAEFKDMIYKLFSI